MNNNVTVLDQQTGNYLTGMPIRAKEGIFELVDAAHNRLGIFNDTDILNKYDNEAATNLKNKGCSCVEAEKVLDYCPVHYALSTPEKLASIAPAMYLDQQLNTAIEDVDEILKHKAPEDVPQCTCNTAGAFCQVHGMNRIRGAAIHAHIHGIDARVSPYVAPGLKHIGKSLDDEAKKQMPEGTNVMFSISGIVYRGDVKYNLDNTFTITDDKGEKHGCFRNRILITGQVLKPEQIQALKDSIKRAPIVPGNDYRNFPSTSSLLLDMLDEDDEIPCDPLQALQAAEAEVEKAIKALYLELPLEVATNFHNLFYRYKTLVHDNVQYQTVRNV